MIPQQVLIDHLQKNYHLQSDEIYRNEELNTTNQAYRELLHKTLVTTKPGRASPLCMYTDIECSYSDFVDSIILSLNPKALKRVSSTNFELEISTVNFQVSLLKGPAWERLCNNIGRKAFSSLLQTCSLHVNVGNAQFHLSILEGQALARKSRQPGITKRHMYYRWRNIRRRVTSMLGELDDIVCRINGWSQLPKNIPKKYRPLLTILRKAISNDTHLSYKSLLKECVTNRLPVPLLAENKTPIAQVARFVILSVRSILPRETLGCDYNWAILNKSISSFLSSPRHDIIDFSQFTYVLKLKSIPWLGKPLEHSKLTSVQDYHQRSTLLMKFIKWLFSDFIVRIVTSFWYVTEASINSKANDPCSSFFLHATWENLSKKWLKDYISIYLHESDYTKFGNEDNMLNEGMLRLLPKKSDFRPLCIPMKHRNVPSKSNVSKNLRSYDYKVIRPVRDLLRFQQRKSIHKSSTTKQRCYSLADVGRRLTDYKTHLKRTRGSLPELHGIQFDMKYCFDNLNQAEVIACVEELFAGEKPDEEFYICNPQPSPTLFAKRRRLSPCVRRKSDLLGLDVFKKISPEKKCISSGSYSVQKFKKSDVINLIKEHVLESSTRLPGYGQRRFKRKRGVFQGLPLSGILCDIVYNSLVDKVFAPVIDSQYPDSLLLRLADDFLFISTAEKACQDLFELALCPKMLSHGAYINKDKCSWSTSETTLKNFRFLGLKIDLRNLNVEKADKQVIRAPNSTKGSLKRLIDYLKWRFRLLLNDYLLDLKLQKIETVMSNVHKIFTPNIECALQNWSQGDLVIEAIANLHLCLVLEFVRRFKKANAHLPEVDDLVEPVVIMMNSVLQSRLCEWYS